MVTPIVIFLDNNCICFAVQGFQVLENRCLFFKTCVTPAVEAQTHGTVRLQQSQPPFDGFYSGFGPGGQAVVPAGKIAAVEQDGVC